MLGGILWGSSGTRPDLAYAAGLLARVQNLPGPEHWNALVGVCHYIKGMFDYGILIHKPSDSEITTPGLGLTQLGYVDSDWAGCADTRRSTSGYIFMMAGAPIAWASKRQSVVALSSTEAEYIAIARGAQQAMWLAEFMDQALLPQPTPFILLGDNLGSISLTKTTKGHQLSKHIDIRHHFLRDLVESQRLEVKPVRTNDNIADIMTKPLSKNVHNRFIRILGLDWMRERARQGEC